MLAFLGSGGCEGVALVGRESLKLDPAELVAEVERIDTRYSERITVVAYSDGTRVLHRGRDIRSIIWNPETL